MTLVDSILAGCYPIVADISAQGEIIRLAGGRAVPADSVDGLIDGLAMAIIWCAQHRDELHKLNERAVKEIFNHFSSEKYQDTLRKTYNTLLANKHL